MTASPTDQLFGFAVIFAALTLAAMIGTSDAVAENYLSNPAPELPPQLLQPLTELQSHAIPMLDDFAGGAPSCTLYPWKGLVAASMATATPWSSN